MRKLLQLLKLLVQVVEQIIGEVAPVTAAIVNEKGEIMSVLLLNGTGGPVSRRVIGKDADGNPTGPLPHATGFPTLVSSDPAICAVSANENEDLNPTLVFDPSGPSVGTCTITAQPQLETGEILAAFEVTVEVHAGQAVTADIETV